MCTGGSLVLHVYVYTYALRKYDVREIVRFNFTFT